MVDSFIICKPRNCDFFLSLQITDFWVLINKEERKVYRDTEIKLHDECSVEKFWASDIGVIISRIISLAAVSCLV